MENGKLKIENQNNMSALGSLSNFLSGSYSRSFNSILRKLSLLIILCGVALVGCGKPGNSQLTSKNLDLVVVGMKKEEVRKILGEPTQVETGQFTLLEKTTYYYESRGAKVTVTFLNDAVMSKEGSFNDQ